MHSSYVASNTLTKTHDNINIIYNHTEQIILLYHDHNVVITNYESICVPSRICYAKKLKRKTN